MIKIKRTKVKVKPKRKPVVRKKPTVRKKEPIQRKKRVTRPPPRKARPRVINSRSSNSVRGNIEVVAPPITLTQALTQPIKALPVISINPLSGKIDPSETPRSRVTPEQRVQKNRDAVRLFDKIDRSNRLLTKSKNEIRDLEKIVANEKSDLDDIDKAREKIDLENKKIDLLTREAEKIKLEIRELGTGKIKFK